VQRLEARLHELEHPEDFTPALYDLDHQFTSPAQLTKSPSYYQLPRGLSPFSSSPESQGYTPVSPFSSPSPTATTPPFETHGGCSPLEIFDSRVVTTPEPTSSSLESDVRVETKSYVQPI
jgi:hypothetical protein